jgi:hypothetical protein
MNQLNDAYAGYYILSRKKEKTKKKNTKKKNYNHSDKIEGSRNHIIFLTLIAPFSF